MTDDVLDPFSLDAAVDGVSMEPPRIVIHGPHGVGKTTFAAGFPSPILLMLEKGIGTLNVRRFPQQATSYDDVLRAIGTLYNSKHDRQTLIVDSADWLEPLVWDRTCTANNFPSIESPGFGKGYVLADKQWAELIDGFDALQSIGMTIIILAHSAITKFQSPEADPFDRYDIALHKRAAAMLHEWADVVGFAHWKVYTKTTEAAGFNKTSTRGIGTGDRLLALEERPAWQAKNRYSLPAEMPLDSSLFLEALAERFASDASASPSQE